jgi:hypothetical protein
LAGQIITSCRFWFQFSPCDSRYSRSERLAPSARNELGTIRKKGVAIWAQIARQLAYRLFEMPVFYAAAPGVR